MSSPRPVRIVRVPSRPAGAPSARAAAAGDYRPNGGGRGRGRRLLLGFLALLAVIYAVFAGLALTAAAPGTRDDPVTWGLFSVVAVALALWGWVLTLGRAPRGAWVGAGHVIVEERAGRVRRFDLTSGDQLVVLQRHAQGLLSPRPTELVELRGPDGRRSYLIEAGLFEGASVVPGA